mmetsp:Transcript_26847/g.49361  ORF Transcript_26847/g.49361 Transcript_26847/m.49361 type:complete len:333 (-) Transcript_26847:220-1218(-)
MAVDPSIEALPYWDQTISVPSVWTADYFGLDPDGSTNFQVTTGQFANWPIASSFSLGDWSSYIADDSTVNFAGNPSGWLRGVENLDTNPYSTRYGGGAAWDAVGLTAATWWGCTTGSSYGTWEDWYWCIEGSPSIHSGPHREIGGTSGDNRGDFEDTVTSPNSPLFMFHHANMDRSKMWWMVAHSDLNCTYYDFPLVDGGVSTPGGAGGMGPSRRLDGYNLNDVVSSSWGFTSDDLGLTGAGTPTSQLTHAELICWMAPATAAYTYDTHVECLADVSACNSVQAAGRPTEMGEGTTLSPQDAPSAAYTGGLKMKLSGVLLWMLLSLPGYTWI